MYKKVKTMREHFSFQRIYEEFCKEQQFQVELSPNGSVKYLFLTDKNKIAGTLETSPYRPSGISTVSDFNFTKIDVISENLESVWEIDKVGLIKKFRKTGLVTDVIHCLVEHSREYDFKYGVCLFEYKFFRLMRILTNSECLYPVSEPFVVEGEVLPIIAVVIDMEATKEWYKENMSNIKHLRV